MVLLSDIRKFTDYFSYYFLKVTMQNKHKIYIIFILFVSLFSYNCSGLSSETIRPDNSNLSQIENNKVKISVEKQKNKTAELEELVKELNLRVEYQENMLSTLSEEFNDQLQVVNNYDSSTSEVTQTLIKMKNKFEVLEDRAFYTDSVYFEIVNDLVEIDLKLQNLSTEYKKTNNDNKRAVSDQEYSNRYSKALNLFFNNGVAEDILDEFKDLISINSNHPLSDNCQYWIGEIYYKQKLFEQSISEFNKVFDFENSNKLDAANYKIILCYINLNNNELAVSNLNKLKKNFPSSEFIDKAEKSINKSTK